MDLLSEWEENGFFCQEGHFDAASVAAIVDILAAAPRDGDQFRLSEDLFAIRQLLRVVPGLRALIFPDSIRRLLDRLFVGPYFVTKAIYFDKPPVSNWYVPYHQDLSIAVAARHEVPGFVHWTHKQGAWAVEPPVDMLAHHVTVRIHLDDTTAENGALYVVPGSHAKGLFRPEHIDWHVEREVCCPVPAGGIMVMRPLLLHRSARTTNGLQRRVIHLEFAGEALPEPLAWSERIDL